MGRCLIFGAAEFDGLLFSITKEDYVIAADSGLQHLQSIGIKPNVVLGDFDSLGYIPEEGKVFPVEKDDTDVMLAVRHGMEQGYREFYIYGALGGKRLDHTIANLQTLAFLRSHGARGFLIGKDQILTVIEKESIHFSSAATGIFSVFSLEKYAMGVDLQGVKYELKNGTLSGDFPLGVSNHFINKDSEISVKEGKILIIWDKNNGIPYF